jgi:hypothetical protein
LKLKGRAPETPLMKAFQGLDPSFKIQKFKGDDGDLSRLRSRVRNHPASSRPSLSLTVLVA